MTDRNLGFILFRLNQVELLFLVVKNDQIFNFLQAEALEGEEIADVCNLL